MPATRTDRAERLILAPAVRLFACWTDPALLVHWLPPRGMAGRVEVFEPRTGGPFRMVLTPEDPDQQGKSGHGQDVIAGQFLVLEPPRHLAFVSRFRPNEPAQRGGMRMDWHFDARGAATLVRIVAAQVPPGISAADHAIGMAAALERLAALVE